MDLGIVGTGDVGTALATGLDDAGHDVVLGSRNPGDRVGAVDVRSQRRAAEHGDVVVLALPPAAVTAVASDLQDALAGKTVVDPANEYPAPGADRSLAARVAEAVPEASVVKAFNTIGANRMTTPTLGGAPATMFVAGDDGDAVETVESLARDLGFDPFPAGDLSAADHLEHLARFWIDLSREHGRDIGFRLLRER